MAESAQSNTISRREFLRSIFKPPGRVEKKHLEKREKVYLNDRNIAIVYSDHGFDPSAEFPNREQAEEDIKNAFAGEPVDGMIVDSFPRFDFQSVGNPLSVIHLTYNEGIHKGNPNFYEWASAFAGKDNIHIIAADPYAYSTLIIPIMSREFQNDRKIAHRKQEEYDAQLNQLLQSNEFKRLEFVTGVGTGLNILFGLSVIYGFAKMIKEAPKEPINRRRFLKYLGFSMGSGVFLGITNVVESFVDSRKEVLKDNLGKEPSRQNFIDWLNLMVSYNEPGELTSEDFAKPSVKRRAQANVEAYHIAIGFRNAMAAEVSLQSLNKLIPGKEFSGRKANIAQVWGYDHANVPEEMRIPYFISHEEDRRNYIRTCIDALTMDYEQAGYGESAKEQLIDDLDRPTSYKLTMSSTGELAGIVGSPFRVLQFLEQH